MPKRPLSLSIRLPAYRPPRLRWRRLIHQALAEAAARAEVQYRPTDRLEVRVRLYLSPGAVLVHDVDNRLKDCLDALQGRLGGPKGRARRQPILPNDNQIFRVTVEKAAAPKQSRGLGHMKVQRYRARRA